MAINSKSHAAAVAVGVENKQFGISPYPGSYGDQPAKWVDRAFIIKNTLAKKEKDQIDGYNYSYFLRVSEYQP